MYGPTGWLSTGYSGAGTGKNNPTEENVQNVGPIPEGFYDVEAPEDSPIHGPYALPLLPDVDNNMYGRSAFLIHGDSIERPGMASEGCIILPRGARESIWESGDHRLQVVKELPTTT
jgi:type VI secretion system (T6SS) effector TldE1-like protein